jgi:glutamyl-tRNA reductase
VKFVVVGLSQKSAPVEIREQAFMPPASVGECVRRLIDHDLIESGVLLSTCNRTELYAVANDEGADDRLIDAFGLWPHRLSFESWQRYAYRLTGREAVAHLFRVAGGLESMVVGEAQVLGQIKDALALARDARAVEVRLDLVLHGAIRAGKRIREETSLGRKPVSVSHAAVAKATELLGDLSGRGVLLIGTGAMSEIALRLLHNQGVGAVYLASRTMERADRVARPFGVRAIDVNRIAEETSRVDIVMSSTGAPHYVLDVEKVAAMQADRSGRPLLVIDMAVPRDIDPAIAGVPGVHLLNIDDLQSIAERNREERKAWLPQAESIIEEEVRRTERALEARDSADMIAALVARVDRIRDEVLERHLARLPDGEEATTDAMRRLAQALSASFLHGPIRALRESPDAGLERAVLAEAFDLDRDSS